MNPELNSSATAFAAQLPERSVTDPGGEIDVPTPNDPAGAPRGASLKHLKEELAQIVRSTALDCSPQDNSTMVTESTAFITRAGPSMAAPLIRHLADLLKGRARRRRELEIADAIATQARAGLIAHPAATPPPTKVAAPAVNPVSMPT